MPSTDIIGSRGEWIFQTLITNYIPGGDPLFFPTFLDSKFRTLDVLVELLGLPAGRIAYFFAQVKATSRGQTKRNPKRLKVNVDQDDIDRLLAYPCPTYVIGVDQTPGQEQAFIASANGPAMDKIQNLSTSYLLNQANLQTLWDEVEGYWAKNASTLNNSAFTI